MTQSIPDSSRQLRSERPSDRDEVPESEAMNPEDVAPMVAYLASDQASNINGQTFLVYGGTIAAGCHNDKELDVVSAFEAWGEKVAGKIDETEFKNVIRK